MFPCSATAGPELFCVKTWIHKCAYPAACCTRRSAAKCVGNSATQHDTTKKVKVCSQSLTTTGRHLGSHSVTCHPTQVNAPRLNPSQ